MVKIVDMREALEQVRGYIVKFANSKGAKIASAWYKDEKSAKEALASIKKNGGNGIISQGKMNEDEKNLEEQKKELEEQLKTAEKQLEELYIKEDKAYVIRFKRIKDKERMVVVFRNQHDADMYADNIKKQGGQVFSNKLEKIPYKVVDKK